MPLRLKNLLSKLELPTNDWVLSRLGGNEPSASVPVPAPEAESEGEQPTESQRPASVAARLLDIWFDQVPERESAEPPQSGERVSRNASIPDSCNPDGKARAS